MLNEIGKWERDDTLENVVSRWSAEDLYYALVKHRDQLVRSLANGTLEVKGTLVNERNKPWVRLPCDMETEKHPDQPSISYGKKKECVFPLNPIAAPDEPGKSPLQSIAPVQSGTKNSNSSPPSSQASSNAREPSSA
jgi:hypothetical protein